MARFTAKFLVDLLRRQTVAAGGMAMILRSGDATSGAILVQTAERGVESILLEQRRDFDGNSVWELAGPGADSDSESRAAYRERRTKADPDIWIIELDVPDAQRLIASWAAAN